MLVITLYLGINARREISLGSSRMVALVVVVNVVDYRVWYLDDALVK